MKVCCKLFLKAFPPLPRTIKIVSWNDNLIPEEVQRFARGKRRSSPAPGGASPRLPPRRSALLSCVTSPPCAAPALASPQSQSRRCGVETLCTTTDTWPAHSHALSLSLFLSVCLPLTLRCSRPLPRPATCPAPTALLSRPPVASAASPVPCRGVCAPPTAVPPAPASPPPSAVVSRRATVVRSGACLCHSGDRANPSVQAEPASH